MIEQAAKEGAGLVLAALLAGCGETPAAGTENVQANQERPATTGDARVDALIVDLTAQRRDAALGRLLGITTITGNPNAVPTVEAFVDKLMACTFLSAGTVGSPGFILHRLLWRCPDGEYEALIDTETSPRKLLIGQFQTRAIAEHWRSTPPPAPPSPVPSR